MERITIYPDKKLRDKLNAESKKQMRSLNNLILLIINKFFKEAENGNGKPRRKTADRI